MWHPDILLVLFLTGFLTLPFGRVAIASGVALDELWCKSRRSGEVYQTLQNECEPGDQALTEVTEVAKAAEASARGDHATAFQILRPLADRGYPPAEYNLGVIYAKGRGVTQDHAEALYYFVRLPSRVLPQPSTTSVSYMEMAGVYLKISPKQSGGSAKLPSKAK